MKKSGKAIQFLSRLRDDRSVYARHDHDEDEDKLVVASYNIHKCIGADGRFDPRRTAAVIDELDADIVALQEADKRFGRRDGLLDLMHVEEQSGLRAVSVATRSDSHGWRGNALLYREGAVRNVRRLPLPGAEPRGAIVVDLELRHGHLRIIAAHLGLLRSSRKRQMEMLLQEVSECGTQPTIILGDLNEWRRGGRSALAGLPPILGPVDSAALPSFPARFPVLALDRVFGTPDDMIRRIEVHDSPLARVASDHRPIKAHLDLSTIAGNAGNRSAEGDQPELACQGRR